MNEKTARARVAQRSGGVCEVCGSAQATNFHHRQNASQGGKWLPSNGLHLCGSGTTGCHGRVTANPVWARKHGWSVPSWDDPRKIAIRLFAHGLVLLDDQGRVEPGQEVAWHTI